MSRDLSEELLVWAEAAEKQKDVKVSLLPVTVVTRGTYQGMHYEWYCKRIINCFE